MRGCKAALFALASLFSGLPGNASAQGFGDLVGGMLQAAQAQAAAEAWSRQPELRRYCFEQALVQRSSSLAQLVRAGMMPEDPRLSSIVQDCRRLEQQNFRTDYRCTVTSDRGELVQTLCTQSFMRAPNQRLDTRAAMGVFFAGGRVDIGEFETEAGRLARVQQAENRQIADEISRLAPQAQRFVSHPLPIVQGRARELLGRITAASLPSAGATVARRSELQRETAELASFAAFEEARVRALAPVERVRAQLTALEGTTPFWPQSVQEERAALEREWTAVVRPPAPLAPRAPGSSDLPSRAGPSFDCGRARTALPQIICEDDGLRQIDLAMVQAFQLLRHLLPEERARLREEAVEHSEGVARTCRLPATGEIARARRAEATACIARTYQEQTRRWRVRAAALGRSSSEELSRSLQEHIRVQSLLARASLLPSDATVDGVYGVVTRAAITAFQTREGLLPDGVMSAETLARLEATAQPTPVYMASGADEALRARIALLEQRYAQLLAQASAAAAERRRLDQQQALIQEVAELAREIAKLNAPPRILEAAQRFIAEVDALGSTPAPDMLERTFIAADQARAGFQGTLTVSRATTPRNAFLLQGDDDEVFVLVNQTPRAPSLVRNLRGEWDFQPSDPARREPASCVASRAFEDRALNRFVNEAVAREHPRLPRPIRLPASTCDSRQIGVMDLVFVNREGLLREPAAQVAVLLSAIDAGVFTKLTSLSAEDVRTRRQADAARSSEIEADVEAARRKGFGMIVVEVASKVVCKAVAEDKAAHDQALQPLEAQIAEEMRGSPVYIATSADGAFISVRRGQCGAIYASSDSLRELAGALRREGLGFRYLPLWLTQDQVELANTALSEAQKEAARAEADRARQRADEERLAAARASTMSEVRARRQADLQRDNRAPAAAFAVALAAEMKVFLEGVSADSGLLQNEGVIRFGDKYPEIRNWYVRQLSDQWQVMTLTTELADYGAVEFRGRSLEAGFATTRIRLRNRLLGEYRDACFITGFIEDKEFAMQREPVSSTCEDPAGRMRAYKVGQRFGSRWLAD